MKNKAKISTRTSSRLNLKHKLLYATSAILLLVLIVAGAFVYLNLGNSEKTMAADGDGTCMMTISSGSTGYNQSFQPYTVNIAAEVVRIVPASESCQWGYNFNVEIAYDISFDGTSRLNTLQGNLVCDSYNLFFEFPYSVRMNGGVGTFITTVNPYRSANDCNTVTPVSLGCNAFTLIIEGEGLPRQTNVPCASSTLLPISLINFEATKKSNSIILDWSTASEVSNDFFTIERSADGKGWNEIGTIDAAGDSNTQLSYRYEDLNAGPGMNYYRLKQTDYNGDFEYFKIINVHNSSTNNPLILNGLSVQHVGPNPFREYIAISYTSLQQDIVELQIIDMEGQIFYQESLQPQIGENKHVLKTPTTLKPGLYLVNITGKDSRKSYRMLKI